MANIISVIQTKGGTGKTTTAMMVSFALSSLGDRVLVLDADKQRSAADWAEEADDDLGFEVLAVPTDRTLETAIRRFGNQDYDFILIDTPPGSSSIVETASGAADLVLIPTGVSPLDMKRTQATLAVVLVNVDKRERLLEFAQETLSANKRAALADVIVPARSATRRAGATVPKITTKPYIEWVELAQELKEAF